ncbi:thioesterase II family protein [Thermoflavimicrobium dichotomicum]|uniref:Surfactin synthase thioesterase subunit n=1 Tax=Thermoflavimicrobium dichotomicum TaxID=46223 RepID=A0A1I3T1L0_9BACL|nr:thioesterase II family protein [Thermoflavimicrobium dichotomicum]SFJ64560.1 Surfactin synthase thioesterase subunit [Thermoflavimicrobium dichotomicum]
MKTNSKMWFPFNKQKTAARVNLFCFPYAGGNPVIFRSWQTEMPEWIEVFPVHLPGRGMRMAEPSYTDLPALIRDLSQAILPYLTKPFVFFGHSMGALVSYELTRYLADQYQLQPNHLIVSAFRAPQLPDPIPPIYHLPDDAFTDELAKMNGMPQEILQNEEILALFLPILRTDFTLCETYTYRPGPLLNCPITVFGGKKDPEVTLDLLVPWQQQTSGAFQLHLFDGDHFFLHSCEKEVLQVVLETAMETCKEMKA